MVDGSSSSVAMVEGSRVFAIYQFLLGWKICKYYYETDELPNPKADPAQEINGLLTAAFAPLFSHSK